MRAPAAPIAGVLPTETAQCGSVDFISTHETAILQVAARSCGVRYASGQDGPQMSLQAALEAMRAGTEMKPRKSPGGFDDAQVRDAIGRLKRAEEELRERIAARRRALGSVTAPITDPLYQRLALVLDGLEIRRAAAERESARKDCDVDAKER